MKKIKRRNSNKFFSKSILFLTKFRRNSIGVEGAKELAKGMKELINLYSLTLNLMYKIDPLRIHHK